MSVEVMELKVKGRKSWGGAAAAAREPAEGRREILRRESAVCTMLLRAEVIARVAGVPVGERGRGRDE